MFALFRVLCFVGQSGQTSGCFPSDFALLHLVVSMSARLTPTPRMLNSQRGESLTKGTLRDLELMARASRLPPPARKVRTASALGNAARRAPRFAGSRSKARRHRRS